MPQRKQFNTKRISINVLWAFLGMSTVVLLGAAINLKNNQHCKGVEIKINGAEKNLFIDKNEVKEILQTINGGPLPGNTLGSFNLSKMENILLRNQWVSRAEIFFDNNDVLRVNVKEREPIARVFYSTGSSFYIDSTITRLPLSDKFSARVPVFTNFNNTGVLSKADSNLFLDIKIISTYILRNPFWMAQIDQVDITPERTFEMVPKMGNQIIDFGSAENYEEKFNNLLTFYRQVESKVGWNKYSKLNVQYKNQLIAVKRGAEDIILDSLRAKEIMQAIVANAQRQANDSINNVQLVQPQDENRIPVAPQIEDLPEEKISIDKPVTPASEKAKPSSIEKPNPIPGTATDKKVTVPTPLNKVSYTVEKPFWLRAAEVKIVITSKKSLSNKKTSSSIERPNPIPVKKSAVFKSSSAKAVNRPAVKSINKPVKIISKPKTTPKAVMPPANDY